MSQNVALRTAADDRQLRLQLVEFLDVAVVATGTVEARGRMRTAPEGVTSQNARSPDAAPRPRGSRAIRRRGDKPDALARFLDRVRDHALLTAEQETLLARQVEEGLRATERLQQADLAAQVRADLERREREGLAAQHEFVRRNMRLVVHLARRYQGNGLVLEDLIQEGVFGLTRAVVRFDWRRGFRFSTYGMHWVRQSLQRAIADRGRLIRLPVHAHATLQKINRARKRLEEAGHQTSPQSLARHSNLPVWQVERLLNLPTVPDVAWADEPVADDGFFPVDMVAGTVPAPPWERNPEDSAVETDTKAAVHRALERLSDRERAILCLRYGLDGDEPRTLTEIGDRLGLTRERIRQLQAKSEKTLRDPAYGLAEDRKRAGAGAATIPAPS